MELLVLRPEDDKEVKSFTWNKHPKTKDITFSRASIGSGGWDHIYAHAKYYWLRIAAANADADAIDKHFVQVNGDFVTALKNALLQNETFVFHSRAEHIKYMTDEREERRKAATINLGMTKAHSPGSHGSDSDGDSMSIVASDASSDRMSLNSMFEDREEAAVSTAEASAQTVARQLRLLRAEALVIPISLRLRATSTTILSLCDQTPVSPKRSLIPPQRA
jgi:hypothetical protein